MKDEIYIYKREIYNSDAGFISRSSDGSFLIKIESLVGRNYLSVGKFVEQIDEFGDKTSSWHHSGYPDNHALIKCKREYLRLGKQKEIKWSLIVSPGFPLEKRWGIALIKTGYQGYIDVFFDQQRLERMNPQ